MQRQANGNPISQYVGIKIGANPVVGPSYDLDGNATGYPLPAAPSANAALVWDAENRLVKVTTATAVTTYDYDHRSRRISKTYDPVIGSTVTTNYLYDGWNLIAEYSGTNLKMTYTWGMDLSGGMQGAGGVGGLLAVSAHDSGTGEVVATYYPTYDGNGNVSEYLAYLADADPVAAGEQPGPGPVAQYEYDPFGNIVAENYLFGFISSSFAHKFSTKYHDFETGLYYYGYRWLDPLTGRWPSRDPIGESGGVNLYGFVGNNGMMRVDYLGTSFFDDNDGNGSIDGWDWWVDGTEANVNKCECAASKVGEAIYEADERLGRCCDDLIKSLGITTKWAKTIDLSLNFTLIGGGSAGLDAVFFADTCEIGLFGVAPRSGKAVRVPSIGWEAGITLTGSIAGYAGDEKAGPDTWVGGFTNVGGGIGTGGVYWGGGWYGAGGGVGIGLPISGGYNQTNYTFAST